MGNNSNRVQARVPDYQKWAIESLVGLIGRNEGDVLAQIVGDWFADKQEWLDNNGLSIGDFRERRLGPKATVRSLNESREPKVREKS